MRDFLSQNWLGTVIGIAGIAYAVFEAKRHRGPILSYQFNGTVVVRSTRSSLPEGMEVSYNGQRLSRLLMTSIIVWNEGASALKQSDLSSNDPVTFCFSEPSTVFLAQIEKVTRAANRFSVKVGESGAVTINFEFLDKNDGALLNIWHDSSSIVPNVSGTIIGQPGGIRCRGRYIPQRSTSSGFQPSNAYEAVLMRVAKVLPRPSLPTLAVMLMIWGTVAPLASVYLDEVEKLTEDPSLNVAAFWIGVLIGLFTVLFGFFSFQHFRRRIPRDLIP